MRDILKPALSLFIICLIVTAALSFTYVGTKDVIAERAALEEENARREVLAGADKFEEIDVSGVITPANPELGMIKKAFTGINGDTAVGYVFTIDSAGYGGNIRIIAGVDKDSRVTGVKVGDNTETPGLGAKASEEPFISQFANLTITEPLRIVKGNSAKPEEIDAISGATVTSKAVVKAVQAAIDMASELTAKEGK